MTVIFTNSHLAHPPMFSLRDLYVSCCSNYKTFISSAVLSHCFTSSEPPVSPVSPCYRKCIPCRVHHQCKLMAIGCDTTPPNQSEEHLDFCCLQCISCTHVSYGTEVLLIIANGNLHFPNLRTASFKVSTLSCSPIISVCTPSPSSPSHSKREPRISSNSLITRFGLMT